MFQTFDEYLKHIEPTPDDGMYSGDAIDDAYDAYKDRQHDS